MKPPNGDRVQEIFHDALALPKSERRAFIAKACAGNIDLEREISGLLKAHDSPGFLQTPVVKLDFLRENLTKTAIDGRYVVERELSHGGMSQVYLAHDLKLEKRPVVIKILSPELLEDSYARQKFKQEVEALLRMRHDGVVGVFDKGELHDGRPYIAMEYVDGETLQSQIPPEGMNLGRAAAILKQIGAALEHVHQNGIFHRDLKPANIILKRDSDSVVLVDFGIAKVKQSGVAPSTIDGTAYGTPGYVSPEQLRGEEITAASDIYSMAVIAYQMLTGRLPFNPASQADLLDMQRAGVRAKPTDLRPDLPTEAEDIIYRALSFKPGARYQNAKEFGDRLAEALLDSRVSPEDRRWLQVLMIVVAVALLSFGVYWYLHGLPGNEPIRSFTAKEPNRSFTYWLRVQPLRDGKEYQSHGEDDTFESGDKFQLNVLSPIPTYLYIINEGPSASNDTNFKMIFPNVATNNGSASLGANQTIQSDWMTFRGPAGDENFWIVWSVSPVPQLEDAKTEAFTHPKGGLTGQNLVTVKEFLRTKQLDVKVTVSHYKASNTAVARGPSDMLVTLAQFKHR